MAMTVVITRDVEDRYRGFLASAMHEVAPGVYVSPHLSARARDTVWDVLARWHGQLAGGSVTMVCPDRGSSAGIAVRMLGSPPRRVVELDGVVLTLRENPR